MPGLAKQILGLTKNGNQTAPRAQLFSEGLAAVYSNGKWGYINVEGNVVIDFQFSDAWPFSEQCAAVSHATTHKIGVIDAKGNLLVDFKFNHYYSANAEYIPTYVMGNGLMQVMADEDNTELSGIWFGYIDEAGNIIYQSSK